MGRARDVVATSVLLRSVAVPAGRNDIFGDVLSSIYESDYAEGPDRVQEGDRPEAKWTAARFAKEIEKLLLQAGAGESSGAERIEERRMSAEGASDSVRYGTVRNRV